MCRILLCWWQDVRRGHEVLLLAAGQLEHEACPVGCGGLEAHDPPEDGAGYRRRPCCVRRVTPCVTPEHPQFLQRADLCQSLRLRGRDSNPDYLIQSQASYH